MYYKRILVLSFSLFIITKTVAQNSQSIGAPVNSQLTSEYSPSLTGNGRTMLFIATTGEDNKPEVLISNAKSGIWSRPEPVPNINTASGGKVPAPKDPIFSYDGKSIYFSASKFGGVGGTDIWYMERIGNLWSLPKNLAKPVNSIGNESDPSISPDGKFLYFVRYTDKKSPSGQPVGKIFVSEKLGNLWKEAKELPGIINTGTECNPRILVDNQTLTFASMRAGGKGGLDQYRTQLKEDGTWSTPEPFTIINTDKDDVYISISAQGDYVYHTGPTKTGTDIFKTKIPDQLKPKKVILGEGNAKDLSTQKPLPSRVVVYNLKKNTLLGIIQTDVNGSYQTYLTEGTEYDFSIIPNNKNYTYISQFLNLDTLSKYKELRVDLNTSALKKNETINLANIAFENESTKLLPRSNYEISRVQRLLQDNPTLKLEIGANIDQLRTDTIASASLTEVKIDSVEIKISADSIIKKPVTIYHNDNTQKQAEAIVNALIKSGISKDRLIAKGYGDKNPLPGNNPQTKGLNKRIEIKVINL
jgi:outer membrane protein OmpA-like peptidoglycan-associated protein